MAQRRSISVKLVKKEHRRTPSTAEQGSPSLSLRTLGEITPHSNRTGAFEYSFTTGSLVAAEESWIRGTQLCHEVGPDQGQRFQTSQFLLGEAGDLR